MKNNYYTILPARVRYDKDIVPQAKLLFSELTVLSDKQGYCWASNAYFANLYGVDKLTVSRWINQLKKKGYIFFKTIDENVNTLDKIIIKHRLICIAPLDDFVKQNIYKINKKSDNARAKKIVAEFAGKEEYNFKKSAYDLEAYEEMLNEK